MSTVSNLNVYKNLLNSISIKAPGKWDKHVNLSFSQNNQNKDILLDDYDGLKYEYEGMDNCAPLLNFEGTVLPNRDKLNIEEYCFMPVGGGDDRTEYTYNFSVVGSPTINDSIAHNFTDSNYIDVDTNVCSLNRIYYAKFTTGGNVSRFQNILAPYPFFELYVEDGKLRSWIESESHAIECGSVETNTTYYAKIVITDDTITLSYSTDGQTYTGDVTDSISFESCDSFHIGKGVYTVDNRWFSGSIDLLGTYVTDSSQHVVYSMATAITTNTYTIKYPKYTDYIKIGSPTIDEETGIVTGFSSSNYLQLSDHFNPGDSAWEVQTKVKTNSVDSEKDIFGTTSDQNLFRVGLAGTVTDRWQILVANNGRWITTSSHYGSYNVLSNTVYWIKAGFNGVDTYYLDYSLDGQTYTRDVTYTSTLKMTPQPSMSTILGSSWDGTVDLSETRILINNEIWWQAKSYIEYSNFDVIGSPTINYGGGMVSEFTNGNYLETNSVTIGQSDNFEMVVTFYINQGASYYSFALGSNQFEKLQIGYSDGSNPSLNIAFDDGTSFVGIGDSYNLSLNSWYSVKIVRENGILSLYVKSDSDFIFIDSAPSTGDYTDIYYVGRNSTNDRYVRGTIDLSKTYIKVNGEFVWTPAKEYKKYLPGILSNYTDDGSEVTLNCFALNDKSIILTPDNSHANSVLLGETTIPVHNVYSYDDGVWIDANGGVHIGPAVVVPEVTPEQDDNGGSDYFSPTDPIVN